PPMTRDGRTTMTSGLGQRAEDAGPRARALLEGAELVFLVGRMDAVVVEREADHQRVHAEVALERADDRDRRAAAHQHRLLAPLGAERLQRRRDVGAFERELQRRARAMRDE